MSGDANGISTDGATPASPVPAIQISQTATGSQDIQISQSAQVNTSLDIYWFSGDRRNKNLYCELDKFGIAKFDGNKIRYRDFCDHILAMKMRIKVEKEEGAKVKILESRRIWIRRLYFLRAEGVIPERLLRRWASLLCSTRSSASRMQIFQTAWRINGQLYQQKNYAGG